MPQSPGKPIRLTDAEWKVMAVVWKQAPVTVRDVVEALRGETAWAYSTVKTLLARLVDKGALTSEKRGNAGVFEPRITERQARGSAVRALLDRAFQGTVGSLVHHLVSEENLSQKDHAELSKALQGLDSEASDEDLP